MSGWATAPAMAVSHDLDDVLPKLDVAYLLRMQLERQEQALVPSLREYSTCFGLTPERAAPPARPRADHAPGPDEPGRGDRPGGGRPAQRRSITKQVANGVAVRMAVLYWLLGSRRCTWGWAADA